MSKSDTKGFHKPQGISSNNREPFALKGIKKRDTIPKDNSTKQSDVLEKPLRNLFDEPMTKRELHQLELEILKGTQSKDTQKLLEKMLIASNELSKELVNYLKAKPQNTEIKPVLQKAQQTKELTQKELTQKEVIIEKLEANIDFNIKLIASIEQDLKIIEGYNELSSENQKNYL